MDYHCSQFVDFEEFAEFSASSSEPSNGLAEFVPQYTYEENFEEVMAKFEGSFSVPEPLELGANLRTASAPPVIREETFEDATTILGSLSNEPEMIRQSNISSVADLPSMHEEYFEEVMAKARALSTERPTVESSCDPAEPKPTVSTPKCTVKPIFRIIHKESLCSKKVSNNATNKNPNTAVIKSTATKSYSTRGGQKEESHDIINDPRPTLTSKVIITTSPPKQITKPASKIHLPDITKERVTPPIHMSQRMPASNVRPIRLQSTAPRFRLATTVTQINMPQPKPLIRLASTVPEVGATSTASQMVPVSTRLKSENMTITVPQVGIMSLTPQTNLPSTMTYLKLVAAGSQIKSTTNHQITLETLGAKSTSQTVLIKTKPNEVLSVPMGIKYVKVTSTKPQVGVMSLPPQTSLLSTVPQVKVVSAGPQLKVASTKSQIGLKSIVSQERETSMAPLLKVHSKTLQITSKPKMSNVKVISTVPHVTMASKIPQRPSPTILHVKVTSTDPNVKTLKQPQISWTSTTLPTYTKLTSMSTLQPKLVPKISLKRKREELDVHRPRKILVTEPMISKVAQASQTTVPNETTTKRLLTYDALCKETLSDYVDC